MPLCTTLENNPRSPLSFYLSTCFPIPTRSASAPGALASPAAAVGVSHRRCDSYGLLPSIGEALAFDRGRRRLGLRGILEADGASELHTVLEGSEPGGSDLTRFLQGTFLLFQICGEYTGGDVD